MSRLAPDTAKQPEKSRFVFAYTNKDVDRLNAELRMVRKERGELGRDHRFETKHGAADFAVGDRVQFTDTLKAARIYNGNAGSITAIDAATGVIRARLDAPAGAEPREVVWSASEFAGFRHGYAGTIYKGQGKTLDETYLLHTHHWRQASSYVALTRQREKAQVFVATETARDVRATRAPDAAERSEVGLGRLRHRRRALSGAEAAGTGRRYARDAPDAKPGAGRAPPNDHHPARTEMLIPPYVDASGRDSLGRGLDPESVRAAVEEDGRVAQERTDQRSYLSSAYRDPEAARDRLDELVARDGTVSAARRIETEPSILGELQGRTGLFAGQAGKTERSRAHAVADALAQSVRRLGDAIAAAERAYRTSVERQRAADAVAIPNLSGRAQAAVDAITTARGRDEQAAAFEHARADKDTREELKTFAAAMERRFGEDGARAILRAEAKPGAYTAPSVAREDQARLDRAAKTLHAVKIGERSSDAVQAERLAARELLRQGRGLKP